MFLLQVFYVGQIIGAIIGKDQACAKRAAKAVIVEYEELPSIITIEEAIASQSFHDPEKSITRGEPNSEFAKCDHVVQGEARSGAQEHFYLETQAAIAVPKGEHGEMEIISSTQSPSATQGVVAHVLGVAKNRVVCKVKRIGGGFGGKETRASPFAAIVAAAAQKVSFCGQLTVDSLA